MRRLGIIQVDQVQENLPLVFSSNSGIQLKVDTSGSSNCDILGGQETGSFSFTFQNNLLAQPFIRVSSVIPIQEIAASTYELLLRLR